MLFCSSIWDTNPGHLQEERQRVQDTVHVVRGLSQVSEKEGNRKTATEPPLSLSIRFLSPFLRIHFPCLSAPRFHIFSSREGYDPLVSAPNSLGKTRLSQCPLGVQAGIMKFHRLHSSLVGPHSACQAGTWSRAGGRGTGWVWGSQEQLL